MKTLRDINNILGDYLGIFTTRVFVVILGLVSTPIITNILGKDGYGQLNLYLMISGIASVFVGGWLASAFMNFGKAEFCSKEKLSNTFYSISSIQVILFVPVVILLLAYREFIGSFLGIRNAHVFVIFQTAAFLLAMNLNVNLKTTLNIKYSYVWEAVSKIFIVITLLMLFHYYNVRIYSVILLYIIGPFIGVLISMRWLKIKWYKPFEYSKEHTLQIILYSYPVLISILSVFLIKHIDNLFIKVYLSVSEVGVYSLAYTVQENMVANIYYAFIVIYPIIVGLKTENKNEVLNRYFKDVLPSLLVFLSFILVAAVAAIPVFIRLLFLDEFLPCILPAQILLASLLLKGMGIFSVGILYAGKKTRYIMFVSLTALSINIIGDILLIPILGIIGAALASAAAFCFSGIYYFIMAVKELKLVNRIGYSMYILPIISYVILANTINTYAAAASAMIIYFIMLRYFLPVNKNTALLLEFINMPAPVKKILYKIYNTIGMNI